MKRLNLTLLLVTAVTISVTGCSRGTLRNLLSRNDYQALDKQEAEQPGFPSGDTTKVVSSETDKADGFFKLPRFLGGKPEASKIAPDPFVTTDEPSPEDKIKAYQARVDERIAREAKAANQTLSGVEEQARALITSDKEKSSNPFSGFGDQNVADAASAKEASETGSSPTSDLESGFLEHMFGQQPTEQKTEKARPLILASGADASAGFGESEQALSDFDQLLHAHEQQESSTQPSTPTASADDSFESLFADNSPPEDLGAKDNAGTQGTFQNGFAFSDSMEPKEPDSGFQTSIQSYQESDSNSGPWGQVNGESKSEDVFTAAAARSEQTVSAADSVFNSDFQTTANRHGFSEHASPWGNLASSSDSATSVDIAATERRMSSSDAGFAASADPFSESAASESVPSESAASQSAFYDKPSSQQSPFMPASQSTPVTTSESTSPGLVIPASENATFFDTKKESPAVQQISTSRDVDDSATVAVSGTDQVIDDPGSAASGTEELAVRNQVSSGSWSYRTLFLIIGCVLIAGLLFLPERQKR